jgi:hypothetical protein
MKKDNSNYDPLWLKTTCDEMVRNAIWQYFIDHSSITKEGMYKAYCVFEDRKDLFRRIEYRFNGSYVKRNDSYYENRRLKNLKQMGFIKRCEVWIYRKLKSRLFDTYQHPAPKKRDVGEIIEAINKK